MTSLRESLRRLLQRRKTGEAEDAAALSYTVHWTRLVREWPPERRGKVARAVAELVADPSFVSNPYGRRYAMPELGEARYAGASLIALHKVLAGYERFNDEKGPGHERGT